MNKTIRKNKYIAPKIIEFDMKSTTILAGSGGPKTDTGGSKVDFNVSESDKNSGAGDRWNYYSSDFDCSWDCRFALCREYCGKNAGP